MGLVEVTDGRVADVLQLAERAAPTLGDDDGLIRVPGAGVSAGDWRLRRSGPR